ncbi:hypothetical protein SASPL_108322 [Salvia splendens]|uniref:Uncharacterized protein n=1 Tax=Salvia splendens TaxID=180675 RepID=A0A8X9A858_SALSN|nr:hypothetical protein SASPL_108322 [Salvia splendens]
MYLSWTWVFWPWAVAIAIGAYGLYSLGRHLKDEATLAEQLAIVTSTLTWLTLVPPAHFNGGSVRCGLREADRHLEGGYSVSSDSKSLSRSDRCSFDRFFSFGGRRAGSTRCICGAGSPVAVVADPGDSSASLISSVPFCHLSFHLLLWIRVALEMDLGGGCLLSHGGRKLLDRAPEFLNRIPLPSGESRNIIKSVLCQDVDGCLAPKREYEIVHG